MREYQGYTMGIRALCIIVFALLIIPEDSDAQFKLRPEPTYFIVAPRKIYPSQVIQVSVTILKMYHRLINVRASIRKDGEEFTSFYETFDRDSTRVLQMLMPENAQPGSYMMRVEGTVNVGFGGFLFQNETWLDFDEKQASVFVQTNKPIYKQGQVVKFRVIPVKPNLMPKYGSMDVSAMDATNTIVRKWFEKQTSAGGIVELELQLSDQPAYGEWKIMVTAFGKNYYKSFEVEEYFEPRFYVNVTMPMYIMEDSFGLAGVITANHTSGRPVKGEGRVRLEIRPALKKITAETNKNYPFIERKIPYFHGRTDFLFTMEEMRQLTQASPAGHELHVNATLTDWFLLEEGIGSAICVVYTREVEIRLLGDQSRTFKPGLPITIYYAVMHQDGTPLVGTRRQVTVERTVAGITGYTNTLQEEKLVVRDDGLVEYSFMPDKNDKLITIKAYYDVEHQRRLENTLYRYYSPSNRYIQISSSTGHPQVNEYMVFTVKMSTFVDTVYYIIAAAGNIVVASILKMESQQKTFAIAASRDMMPTARIVVYYIYEGEVIADSLNFFVNGTRMNKVEVNFNAGKDFSGDTMEVVGTADPGSYIAFSGLDLELYAYGGNTFLTETALIEDLKTFDSYANHSFSHKWKVSEEYYEQIHFSAPTYGVDANTTFEFAGLIVFTDANLTRVPNECNVTKGFLPCMDGTCYMIEQHCNNFRDCPDGVDEMGCEKKEVDYFTPPLKRMKHIMRHFMQDGSWLWQGAFTKPDGRIDFKVEVPKEPMFWMVNAFSISREKGLGVMHQPTIFEQTQDFYMMVEMPEVVVKGEQIGVRVALFNYWDRYEEILITLHKSDKYLCVKVSDFGVVSSYKPDVTDQAVQTMVYLEPGRQMTIHFPVLPTVTGEVEVEISAVTSHTSDSFKKKMFVIMDGVRNYLHTPYLIDLVSQGSVIIPDLWINVTERFIHPEVREHLYVPGSTKATLGIVGDVVGPAFFDPHLTSENMIRLPYGCAEQNAFNFGANLYYLKFLKSTNQLTRGILNNALGFMNLVLQRQMSYYNETGYMSSFRDYRKETPSLWLTAISLKTLYGAREADWKYDIHIPIDLLSKMAIWICDQQDTSTGAFRDVGLRYDRKIKDNFTKVNELELGQNISITAHVLIALEDAKELSGVAKNKVDTAKKLATYYLETHINDLHGPYMTALVTHALFKSSSGRKNDAFTKLDAMKIVGDNLHWAIDPIPPNPSRIFNTVPFRLPRIVYPFEGSAIEATSYALMVYLSEEKKADAQKIMKWLQTMRNTISGFASTRDSLVALEALSEYARQDDNRKLYNMRLFVEATADANWKRTIDISKAANNFALYKSLELPKIYGSVKCNAQGTGVALMQLMVEYNVEYDWLLTPKPVDKFFDLVVDRLYFHGKNFSVMEMTTCAQWMRPDLGEHTGMSVMEIDIPTGFVIMNDVLRRYVQSGEVPSLGRAEFFGRRLIFYFDYLLASQRTCVKFTANRWFPVANATIQHKLKVYDYYEPGMHNTTMYTTYSLFNLHICQVCGSFQCPYCPFYNVAGAMQISVVTSLLATAFVMFINRWQHYT